MKDEFSHRVATDYPWTTVNLESIGCHPWSRLAPNTMFLVPLVILRPISSGRGREGASTDLGDGSIAQVPLDKVWEGIKSQGMRDPLVISIGLTPGRATIRLESGNHRIFPAEQDGLSHLPVIGIASSQSILNPGTGDHAFPFDRSGLDEWLSEGGRSVQYFEPYPHPVDLRAALNSVKGADEIIPTQQIETVPHCDPGLIRFRRNQGGALQSAG